MASDQCDQMSGHKPFMNLGIQTISNPSIATPQEGRIPRAFNHKNAFLVLPPDRFSAPVATSGARNASGKTNHRSSSKHASTQQRQSIFQHSTQDSMKVRLGHVVQTAQEPSIDLPCSHKRRRTDVPPTIVPKKPTLRSSRPLRNAGDVDVDIWQNILSFCEPKFLLEAKTINSFFYHILCTRQSIWRESRQNHFGEEVPDCPERLTEQQYVDLLVGRGCQSSTCTRQNTVKVYWTFLGRLCTECLTRKTLRGEDLAKERQHTIHEPTSSNAILTGSDHQPLWAVLPMAASNGRRYLHARPLDESRTKWESGGPYCHLFLKSDYFKLEEEYLQLKQEGRNDIQIREWWKAKFTTTVRYMNEASKLEMWNLLREVGRRDVRYERKQFFIDEAANLSPPMRYNILSRMAAFQKALNSNNPPSARAWMTLKAKILPYRQQAELLQRRLTEMGIREASPTIDLFRRLHVHRSGRRQDEPYLRPEQQFIINMATEEFEKNLLSEVADSDLVLLTLHNVFQRYEQCENPPIGLNCDGTYKQYKLTMDDARMIVEEVMEERISRFSQRGCTIFESFKCAGCLRRDYSRKWSFIGVFEHILAAHSQLVGQGHEFWRFAVPFPRDHDYERYHYQFPWYTILWPRCLPVLPEHRDAGSLSSWHPDAQVGYVQLQIAGSESAFDGRHANYNEIPGNDFGGSFLFAAKCLVGIRLSSPCLTKIALEYALVRYLEDVAANPSIEVFMQAVPKARDANSAMDFKFKCGHCKQEGRVYRSARQVKYFIPIEQLYKHFEDKHRNLDWTKEFLDLPTGSEVYDEMLESDRKLKEEQDAARAASAAVVVNNRKKPNAKASIILGTSPAMEAFAKLFTKDDKKMYAEGDIPSP